MSRKNIPDKEMKALIANSGGVCAFPGCPQRFVEPGNDLDDAAFLGEMAHLLNAIFNALQQRKSPYASVLGALLELAGEQAHAVRIEPDEAIDAAWEEPAVFDGCSSKGQGRSGQAQPITFVRNEASGLKVSGAAHNGVSP